MDGVGYSRCEQCGEENLFRDGSKCARCLGVSYGPVNDEDNEEESSNVSLVPSNPSRILTRAA